jgi:hypothetical protein
MDENKPEVFFHRKDQNCAQQILPGVKRRTRVMPRRPHLNTLATNFDVSSVVTSCCKLMTRQRFLSDINGTAAEMLRSSNSVVVVVVVVMVDVPSTATLLPATPRKYNRLGCTTLE